VGKFCSTMKIVLIFLECVRGEGTKDQLMISDKMARMPDSKSPDNPSIRAEKIIRPRPDYRPLAFMMPS